MASSSNIRLYVLRSSAFISLFYPQNLSTYLQSSMLNVSSSLNFFLSFYESEYIVFQKLFVILLEEYVICQLFHIILDLRFHRDMDQLSHPLDKTVLFLTTEILKHVRENIKYCFFKLVHWNNFLDWTLTVTIYKSSH